MRLHVISDVHGNAGALARAADGADGLIVLGDLLEFIDYRDPSNGIVARLLGEQVSAEFGRLRRIGAPRAEMLGLLERSWARFDDPAAAVEEAVSEQYAELFGVLAGLGVPVWAIPGNVDLPRAWPDVDGVVAADGRVLTIGGVRIGFLGGVPLPPGVDPRRTGPWQPHLLAHGDWSDRLAALGPADVLCTHVPPAHAGLTYDVVTRRAELASGPLAGRIAAEQPSHAMFGHVHQPLHRRARIGRTECVNAGHFRVLARPYVLYL
ncbi:metallophosphoesterase family protein [Pseudonocardia sp. HH130630-07]|uniref:metallophosphoesterase family protein n=1 Tax=Pseudonocardia sp. HH130630-07 TaxID=1690815 RepID=UPI000814C705|nr:metallophosphoesterase [Pseudonocardia sp. HH130630-07]ANY05120.1 metallophosphoesterase [Pseudonocardia sp. HH130630-07]